MTQMNLTPYRAFWQKQHLLKPGPESTRVGQQARLEAERLGRFLAAEFNVSRVYLFGSYAWGLEIQPDSDLDLAVEGLSNEADFVQSSPSTIRDLRGIAGNLADIYQGAENCFQRIARVTREQLPSGSEWHR